MQDLFQSLNEIYIGPISLSVILSAALTLIVCLVAIRILLRILKRTLSKTKIRKDLQGFFLRAANIGMWVIAIIITTDALGIPTASLVAVLSITGLALSLSVQDTMQNLFAGVTLLFTKPFASGDYIEVSDKGGTVKTIGLFYTVIETPDMVAIYLPNSDVTTAAIHNYNTNDVRRISMTYKVSSENTPDSVRNAIIQVAESDGRILKEPEPFITITGFGENCAEYSVRVWCKGDDYWNLYFALNEAVFNSFEKNGIKMAYNHVNVHVDR